MNLRPQILITFLAIGSLFTGCSELSEEQSARVEEALRDTLVSTTESWDMTMNILEDGQRKLQLKGRHATSISRSDTQLTRIQGPVHIKVYDSTGSVTTLVRSDRAIYFSQHSIFEFFGNVRVEAQQDRGLRSEYLKWDQNNDRVTTPRFITITTPRDSIAGHGFSGTPDLTDYSIREVSGHVTFEQEKDTTR